MNSNTRNTLATVCTAMIVIVIATGICRMNSFFFSRLIRSDLKSLCFFLFNLEKKLNVWRSLKTFYSQIISNSVTI